MSTIQIVIVDDHTLFRVGLVATIEHGCPDIYVTGQADCGAALFALLPSTPVDLVLLDIKLPDMGGAQIARQLRRDYPLIKIVAVSAENAIETIEEMLEAGIDGFVSKQRCDATELASAVRTVMGGLGYFGRDISAILMGIYASKKKSLELTSEFTDRERQIILLCRDGFMAKEIADQLGISTFTVNEHKKHIFKKLGINNTREMVHYALKKGIIRI